MGKWRRRPSPLRDLDGRRMSWMVAAAVLAMHDNVFRELFRRSLGMESPRG